MNNKLIALAVAASVTAGMAAPLTASAAVESKWFGYSQLTMEKRDDQAKTSTGGTKDQDGLAFGADRVRIGYKIKDGKVFGKLQVDFNKPGRTKGYGTYGAQDKGGVNEIIKDAVGGYKFSNAAKVSIGQFKTPLGMDFNNSGKKLDITKRGMEKKLVLERTQGLMLSGRKMSGFGYDVFYGNASTRSSATSSSPSQYGKDNTSVIRVMYDMGKLMHAELSTGKSTVDGGTDYKVTDFGLAYKRGPMTGKFEYIVGKGVNNVATAKEKVWFAHFGYQFSKTFEGVIRYYSAKDDGNSRKLSNTFIGANLFLGSNKTNGRLQLNYVIAGGDTSAGGDTTAGTYNGKAKGYTDDAILVQYQVGF